ncbi:MAG: hypothetical protein SFX73_23485 [Kofleriaceae bacterium]|nr:hypothetical protein [Kofleriaceae bacterium]
MRIGRLLGLAAIGGLLYAHKRHGGQFTLDSLKHSGRDLMDAARSRGEGIREKASTRVHAVADRVGEKRRPKETIIEEVTGGSISGSGGYTSGYPKR